MRSAAPSDPQCRSDYEAHCASIPPGGKASLQCLQQNMSSLSSGCQAAVRAVEAPAAPKAESTPAAPKAEVRARPPQRPSRPLRPRLAAARPPQGGSRHASQKAEQCADRRDPKRVPHRLSEKLRRRADRRRRGVELSGKEQGETLGGLPESRRRGWRRRHNACGRRRAGGCNNRRSRAAPAATPAPARLVLRPMRPREVVFVLRSACGEDVRALCGGVPAGGGRIMQCLAAQAASLSPACADVLSQFAAQ